MELKNNQVASGVASHSPLHSRTAKMLSSALPFVALAMPGQAFAADAVNTATITAPAGAIEANTANNSATDTDNVLAALTADDDGATGAFGFAGNPAVVNVLDGDTVNGVAATPSEVTLSIDPASSLPAELTFNTATGAVGVVEGTPAGTYSFDYQICETANPTNCVTATVTIVVTEPVILATADSATGVDGNAGVPTLLNVLDNDTIGGVGAATDNVDIVIDTPPTPINGGPVPALDPATGIVSVPAGTPAGDYTITYTIVDEDNPGNTSQTTVTITVAPPILVADDETITGVNGVDGENDIINVLDGGDTINGDPATVDNIDISILTPATPANPGDPVPVLDPATGLVSVPPGTPAGTYTITFQICDEVNPTVCSDPATVTVTVDPPAITADDDSVGGLNGVTGGTDVLDVLDGDTYNGAQVAAGDVVLTVDTPAAPNNPGDPVPTLDVNTGQVQVPANTPAGTYEITYRITDPLNPTNFAIATATVVIAPSIDLSITKSNGVNTVTSGQTITYTLVISNSGPDAATGALLTDTPGTGLTCPTTNSVTFSGDGIPSGSFTVGDLTGSGIILGTIGSGQSLTVTYDCTVD